MGYVSDAQRKAVHASKADGGKGNPNKMITPLNFGVSGIFGRMGQNPSINALTNANALAQQQLAQQNIQPLGSGTTYRPDMSQQIMTGSFDPLTQQVGMGIFGDQNARNMAVRGSGLMMHGDKFRDRAKKLSEGSEQGDYDYDNPKVVKLLEKARKADESHKGSPAKNTGEKPHGTYADQGLIKSYKKGDKYVAIDKSVHDTYEKERLASGQALTRAKKKAREARRNK
jgi:hypothetical protein